ncbi:MAG: hypothetical protein IPG96_07730 [Proteobacteria bacterium]|nr:hypothetical protein [Pseudomonadota bacterium]
MRTVFGQIEETPLVFGEPVDVGSREAQEGSAERPTGILQAGSPCTPCGPQPVLRDPHRRPESRLC